MNVACSSFIGSRTSAHYVSHTQTLQSSPRHCQEAPRIVLVAFRPMGALYLTRVPGAGGEGLER
jgi:hypothetical protein